MTVLRLAQAALSEPVMSLEDRQTLAMSTLIASDEWLLEAEWDGARIGDIHIFRNRNVDANGNRRRDLDGKVDEGGNPILMPHEWRWFAGVPCGKIKSYYFLPEDRPSPRTLNAEPQTKPGPARKGSAKEAEKSPFAGAGADS